MHSPTPRCVLTLAYRAVPVRFLFSLETNRIHISSHCQHIRGLTGNKHNRFCNLQNNGNFPSIYIAANLKNLTFKVRCFNSNSRPSNYKYFTENHDKVNKFQSYEKISLKAKHISPWAVFPKAGQGMHPILQVKYVLDKQYKVQANSICHRLHQ